MGQKIKIIIGLATLLLTIAIFQIKKQEPIGGITLEEKSKIKVLIEKQQKNQLTYNDALNLIKFYDKYNKQQKLENIKGDIIVKFNERLTELIK